MQLIQKTFLFVIESLGVGEAPDAVVYGDKNASTLGHVAEYCGGLNLPTLGRFGLGNITYVKGIPRSEESIAYFGKCRQMSDGKDNITGHWEITGYSYPSLYHTDPAGFFPQFVDKLEREFGRKCIFNLQYKNDQILERYYYDHITDKSFIVFYNKSDMTLNIAASPDIASAVELEKIVKTTHDIGEYYGFIRTRGIHIKLDVENHLAKKTVLGLSRKPDQTTLLGSCKNAGIPVHFIGRKQDIFHDAEFNNIFITDSDEKSTEKLTEIESVDDNSNENGQALYYLVFSDINTNAANGKNIKDYATALQKIDGFLQKFIRSMNSSDILIITASNGNDPSLNDSVHTREYLPVMAYSRVLGVRSSGNLGVRRTLSDVAETISDIYSLETHYGGDSFWNYMLSQI
jgi:phosphopentomutase